MPSFAVFKIYTVLKGSVKSFMWMNMWENPLQSWATLQIEPADLVKQQRPVSPQFLSLLYTVHLNIYRLHLSKSAFIKYATPFIVSYLVQLIN